MEVSAYLEIERSIAWKGMPSNSTSTGWVIRDSTSSGVMPGALMMIFTCVGEISGNASIGMFINARTPKPVRSSERRMTNKR